MPFLRFAVLLLAVLASGCQPSGPTRVLVFSKTAGYRHESIGPAKAALMAIGTTNGMVVDTTENSAYFQDDSLKHYAAVVFVSTTGNVLTRREEVALQRYMEAGVASWAFTPRPMPSTTGSGTAISWGRTSRATRRSRRRSLP